MRPERLAHAVLVTLVVMWLVPEARASVLPGQAIKSSSGDRESMLWSALDDASTRPVSILERTKLGPDIDGKDLLELPEDLLARPSLAQLAVLSGISRPTFFADGVYGKLGSGTVYATTVDRVADFDRLWWVMVRVLSEKYGCFIVNRSTTPVEVAVGCRDRRQVVFTRAQSSEVMMFVARQYDQRGAELAVEGGQVVARGGQPVAPVPGRSRGR